MSSHGLTIKIPICEPIECLIAKLRFLETIECRATMSEAERVRIRAGVTAQFRQALKFKEYTHKVTSTTEIIADYSRDEIYS